MKSSELDSESKFDSEQDKGKRIIDAKINATITTAEIQPKEPKEPKEEGERLFHSNVG